MYHKKKKKGIGLQTNITHLALQPKPTQPIQFGLASALQKCQFTWFIPARYKISFTDDSTALYQVPKTYECLTKHTTMTAYSGSIFIYMVYAGKVFNGMNSALNEMPQ